MVDVATLLLESKGLVPSMLRCALGTGSKSPIAPSNKRPDQNSVNCLTELRRRREEAQVEIRKQKREESVAKRRNFNAPTSDQDSDDEGAVDSTVSPGTAFTRHPCVLT